MKALEAWHLPVPEESPEGGPAGAAEVAQEIQEVGTLVDIPPEGDARAGGSTPGVEGVSAAEVAPVGEEFPGAGKAPEAEMEKDLVLAWKRRFYIPAGTEASDPGKRILQERFKRYSPEAIQRARVATFEGIGSGSACSEI